MRCISDEIIQKFVDKEAFEKENSIVQKHLSTCGICVKKVEERRYTTNRIKELIGSHNKNEIQVPEFQLLETQGKVLHIPLRRIVYVASAATACLLVLFLLFHQKSNDEIEFIYSYSFECEYNANLPLSEQEMVIEVKDANGKPFQN